MSTEQEQRNNLIGMQLMSGQYTHEMNPVAKFGMGLSEQ